MPCKTKCYVRAATQKSLMTVISVRLRTGGCARLHGFRYKCVCCCTFCRFFHLHSPAFELWVYLVLLSFGTTTLLNEGSCKKNNKTIKNKKIPHAYINTCMYAHWQVLCNHSFFILMHAR